ncbi:MAG: metal ABC transporter substrate-binding protein [Planctomycetota bacterium]
MLNPIRPTLMRTVAALLLVVAACLPVSAQDPAPAAPEAPAPLRVVATLPDLGDLAETIGGDDVHVQSLVRGPQDPHHLVARPGFIPMLAQADALVLSGMELEVGWLPPLLENARNTRLVAGDVHYIDCSVAIVPLEVPNGVSRDMGDVHPAGNPHYLLDPINGLHVARLLRDRFSSMRPDATRRFADRCDAFERKLAVAMAGEKLAAKYSIEKLAAVFSAGKLQKFLEQTNQSDSLGGWFKLLVAHHGAHIIDDHDAWLYFARRFSLVIVGHLEPKPGISPTTTHLATVIDDVRSKEVKGLIQSPYFDPAHARFVCEKSGVKSVVLAHQVGSVDGTAHYLDMIDLDVRRVAGLLGGQ